MVGQFLPLLLAAVAIPLLIRRLGVDRFGVLTLAWALVGYFGLFDLGLGRALTKVVTELLAQCRESEAGEAVWTGISILLAVGALFTVLLFLFSHWLVIRFIKLPAALESETLSAIYWLAISVPVITVTAGLRGVLEAQHRFRMVNIVRIVMGSFSYLGPLAASIFSTNLAVLCSILVIGRVLAGLIHFLLAVRCLPVLLSGIALERRALSKLATTGAWITVSNIVGPILTYAERFIIGFFLSVAAVAYYATPSELVLRLLMIPGAITSVLFPAFAALSVVDTNKLHLTYDRGIRFCFMLIFPVIFVIFLFAPEGLRLWLGPVFAEKSTILLRWVSIGILVNSIAQIPFALLQAANRPDLPGKLHLIEVPLYLAALIAAIKAYALPGAAAVWALRLIIEGLVLLLMAQHALVPSSFKQAISLLAAATAVIAMCLLLSGPWSKLVWLVGVLCGDAWLCWRFVLRQDERSRLALFRSSLISGR
jgi:O-antigen/teichoic acid export membrane protein